MDCVGTLVSLILLKAFSALELTTFTIKESGLDEERLSSLKMEEWLLSGAFFSQSQNRFAYEQTLNITTARERPCTLGLDSTFDIKIELGLSLFYFVDLYFLGIKASRSELKFATHLESRRF